MKEDQEKVWRKEIEMHGNSDENTINEAGTEVMVLMRCMECAKEIREEKFLLYIS